MRPSFIVLEGGEGAGKSTLAQSLKIAHANRLVTTREPGGSTQLGEDIRALVLSENASDAAIETQMYLMWAARTENWDKLILPTIKKGHSVLSDRAEPSTFAYQLFGGDRQDLIPLFWEMWRHAIAQHEVEIHYVWLDGRPEVLLPRAHSRADQALNHFDTREMEFHERVREGHARFFVEVGRHSSRVQITRVDAERSAEDTKIQVLHALKGRFVA